MIGGLTQSKFDELREARDLTQQHLASLLGINQAAVSKMERRADMYIPGICRMQSKTRLDSSRAGLFGCQKMLGDRRPLGATLRRDGLSDLAHEEGLQIRFRRGGLQTDNGVSGLAHYKIALTVGAGNFKLAGLAL
jgi:transcriptional regulator with XRE-family HTH domain